MTSTTMLERRYEEIRRRTRVVRTFPDLESCLRPVRALAVEIDEGWLEASRYLDMDLLKEHKKEHPPARPGRLTPTFTGPPCRACAT